MTSFAIALQSKLDASRATISATNEKKMNALIAAFKNEEFCKLLQECNIDAARFTRAIYASEKIVKFARHAVETFVDFAKVNENAHAAFVTAMRCANASVTLTKRDIEASISKDVKATDDKKALIFKRNVTLSAETLNAQSQQCVDMLKTLNIIREVSSQTYEVTRNALADKLCEKLNVTV